MQILRTIFMTLFAASGMALADDGYEAWLRYRPLPDKSLESRYGEICRQLVVRGEGEILTAAADELERGIQGMLGRKIARADNPSTDGALILATEKSAADFFSMPETNPLAGLSPEGFAIFPAQVGQKACMAIVGKTNRGALYGAYRYLRQMQTLRPPERMQIAEAPAIPLRLLNLWDNPDGTVERGYAGRSVLYEAGRLIDTPERHRVLGRLMASVGINGIAINNVNTGGKNLAGWKLLTSKGIREIVRPLADIFRPHGVRVFVSINFASPMLEGLGTLDTADPLDPAVRNWWKEKAAEIYAQIPDFGGWLIKADSEGQAGPSRYGRNHAEGANMLAEALEPHGGRLIWRAFVYGFTGKERASQAYEQFRPLDGQFAENTLVQIKNGPLDFQVREPVSPLLGAMPRTNQMLELQITQEYTGHSTHLCYLVPSWKEVLDFDTHARGEGSQVSRVVSGELFGNSSAGVAGVANIGRDRNWTGHLLAQANLYGFGRLAWNPSLSAGDIAREWVPMALSTNPETVRVITDLLLESWKAYENYTSPLGVGILCEGAGHFDPMPAIRTNYHGASSNSVGKDRTMATGTGYTGQYHSPCKERYESLETCPEELLLFFHHVPYGHRLQSGKTVIEHIYDTHREGVRQVERMLAQWRSLEGNLDSGHYQHVLSKFEAQLTHARLWRDTINDYFSDLSGIPWR